jgi:hypothetical protein
VGQGVDAEPKKSIITFVKMLEELLLCAIASSGFAFLISGWGLFSKNPEDKAMSKKYILYIFLGAFALCLYGSDFWKSDLWK